MRLAEDGATAQAMVKTMKKRFESCSTALRPHISDSGARKSGPMA